MKRIIILSALMFSIPAHSDGTVPLNLYDNLTVTVNKPRNSVFSCKETQQGVHTLRFSNNGEYVLLMDVAPVHTGSFNITRLKNSLLETGKHFLPQSEETSITVHSIVRDALPAGYYYHLTDRNPKKNGYKYLTQGYILYNVLLGRFTFLYNREYQRKIFHGTVPHLISARHRINRTQHFESLKFYDRDLARLTLRYTKYFYSPQQKIFYMNPEIYSSVIPTVLEKYSQSICTDSENGTVFYYYFNGTLTDAHAHFLRGLFYGNGSAPSKDHPEKILMKNNYLIVFSYPHGSTVSDFLYAAISRKLQGPGVPIRQRQGGNSPAVTYFALNSR